MGISGFLSRVLDSAGSPCNLRQFETGVVDSIPANQDNGSNPKKRRRRITRPLRVGIDVSSWIYQAAHGYGDMLADERHLTNYGRASLHNQQQQQQQDPAQAPTAPTPTEPTEEMVHQFVQVCIKFVLARVEVLQSSSKAEILVVLDGSSPPIKEREAAHRRALRQEHELQRDQPVDPNQSPAQTNLQRTRAFRRAGAGKYYSRIVIGLMEALIQAQVPFLVAPYEADSQLAYLSDQRYIDLVVTEDSDLIAHGARAVLYKLFSSPGFGYANQEPIGKLLKFTDIGAVKGSNWNLMDFSPVMMSVLFVATGCDYCQNLKGIGLLTAARIIRRTFLETDNEKHRVRTPQQQQVPSGSHSTTTTSSSSLQQMFDELYYHTCMDDASLTPAFKQDYEERFLAAIFMYRHPIVYDPVQRRSLIVSRGPNDTLNRENRGDSSDDDLGDNLGDTELDAQSGTSTIDAFKELGDEELLEYEPYARLCRDKQRIENIIGKLETPKEATLAAQGYKLLLNREKASTLQTDTTVPVSETQETGFGGSEDQSQQLETQDFRPVVSGARLSFAVPNGEAHDVEPTETEDHPADDDDDDDDEVGLGTQPTVREAQEGTTMPAATSSSPRVQGSQVGKGGSVSTPGGAVHAKYSPLPSQSSSSNDVGSQSPNLLYSTTPEKTQGSSSQNTDGTPGAQTPKGRTPA